MTTYLDHGTSDSVTTLSRFPAGKAGSSFLAAIESTTDGVIVVDTAHHIVLVNHKTEHLFGYPAEQLLDKPLDVILPPRLSTEQRRRIERLATMRNSGRQIRLGLRGLHANGEQFPLTAYVSRITAHGETFLAVILRNPKLPSAGERKRHIRSSDLRKLAVSSQQASEVEKRRFSRELYDDIGQRLSVLKLDLDWLEKSLPGTNEYMPARVAQMQDMLDKVITLTKSMASTLRPPLLDDFGLMPAVEWMTENFQKRNGVTCVVQSRGMKIKFGDPIESAVFRVIQEGLLNIEKHANASNVKIVIEHTGRCLHLLIEDDGTGMPPECENKPGCYGLIAMQERIFVLGGTIAIANARPRGVTIHATIPVDSLSIQ